MIPILPWESKSWWNFLYSLLMKPASNDHIELTISTKETAIFCGILVGIASIGFAVRSGLKRYRCATDLPSSLFEKPSMLRGIAVWVNDSDNVRFFHTPLLFRIWYSLTGKRLRGGRNGSGIDIRSETINVRLAGIDAPELAHFGMAEQPYAKEAIEWLRKKVQGRSIKIRPLRIDQYQRLVASVWVRRLFFWWQNVSLEMVRNGYATMYTGIGAEYDGLKGKLEQLEQRARRKQLGMWQQLRTGTYVSPAEHKNNFRAG